MVPKLIGILSAFAEVVATLKQYCRISDFGEFETLKVKAIGRKSLEKIDSFIRNCFKR